MPDAIDRQFIDRVRTWIKGDTDRAGTLGRMAMAYNTLPVQQKPFGAEVQALALQDRLVGFNRHSAQGEVGDFSYGGQLVARQLDISANGVALMPPLIFPLAKVAPTSGGARDIQSCHMLQP